MVEETLYISPAASAQSRLLSFDVALPAVTADTRNGFLDGIRRRWQRERRRRKVGRAYDMATEIASLLPRQARVLDVGCGNGFIAHHLSALIGAKALGIDLDETTDAPIHYRQFDGRSFPVADRSVDAAVLCYVLHHAQELTTTLEELHRVMTREAIAVVYEDMPDRWWDRIVCLIHDRKWRNRTGPCNFRNATSWRAAFDSAGFELTSERELSRWRNLAHPVSRRLFIFRKKASANTTRARVRASSEPSITLIQSDGSFS